jgi:hypothetical protein
MLSPAAVAAAANSLLMRLAAAAAAAGSAFCGVPYGRNGAMQQQKSLLAFTLQ